MLNDDRVLKGVGDPNLVLGACRLACRGAGYWMATGLDLLQAFGVTSRHRDVLLDCKDRPLGYAGMLGISAAASSSIWRLVT